MGNECGEYQGLIAVGIYGQLTAAEARTLQSHLAACEDCRREGSELNEAAHLAGLVKAEPVGIQKDAFTAAVRRKIGSKTHRRLPAKKLVVRKQNWIIPATLAAALLIAAAGIFLLTRPQTQPIEIAVRPVDPTPVAPAL
ncbi:MAG: zf-HC2 domain-containing protein, partial [Planctomycetes bacterium]|nr:zf-HC2 domain-containing protein [Planctomycetota bacterium]